MGEVYRAHDPQLNRDVAIKVLPAALANDADYLAHFQREAQTLAALNHPNIAAIYGLEGKAIVMELVEGETLKGPLPLAEALPLAKQIAEALEAAHEKNIIHRDLKPGNVKVTPEGVVKVLDFGLAKAINERPVATGPDSPTLTMRATEAGLILGTAGYMSPEQAAGKNVDRRADIWSFGVVLYELLTGKRLFDGETVTHTLADVVRAPIDLSGVPLKELLERCLDRNIKTRLRHIGEARIALENYREAAQAKPIKQSNWIPWAVAAVASVVAAGAWLVRPAAEPKPLVRFNVDLGRDAQLGLTTTGPNFAISANGRRIAYVVKNPSGGTVLATRTLDQDRVTLLLGTESAVTPFLSPDGTWVAFVSNGKLKKVSTAGGGAIVLADTDSFRDGVWTDDDHLVFALTTRSVLSIMPASGGTPQPLTKLNGEEKSHRWPVAGPDGTILFMSDDTPGNYEDAVIEAVVPKTGQRIVIHKGGYYPQYVASGHLLSFSKGALLSAPLDRSKLALTRTPTSVRGAVEGGPGFGCANLQVSSSGVMLYRAGNATMERGLSWVDAAGTSEVIPIPPGAYQRLELSPDNKRISLGMSTGVLSIYDLERKILTRLTSAQGITVSRHVWTKDGRHIFYRTDNGIVAIPSDGSRAPQEITKDAADLPSGMGPDSSKFYFRRAGQHRVVDLDWSDPMQAKVGKEEAVPIPAFSEIDVSPDGRWLAYLQTEGNYPQAYVRPRDTKNGGRWQVSTDGASSVRWSPNGRDLLFGDLDRRAHVVPYTVAGEAFVPGQPKRWEMPGREESMDVFATDGKRLLYATTLRGGENQAMVLELNFAEELLQRKDLSPK